MNRMLFAQQLTEISTTRKEALGALVEVDGKIYKYVQIKNTTATVAGVAGDPVAYGSSNGYESNLVVVDLTDADAVPVGAGFLCGSVTGTAGTSYYGWIQLSGVVTVPTAITSGVVGRPVYITTTDKTLAIAVEADSAAAYKQTMGVELTATAAHNKIVANCIR